jgi:hypothetical protein
MVKFRDIRITESGVAAASIEAGQAVPIEHRGSIVAYVVPAAWVSREPADNELVAFYEFRTKWLIAWLMDNLRRAAENRSLLYVPLSMSKGKRSGGGRVHRGWLVPATRMWEKTAAGDD